MLVTFKIDDPKVLAGLFIGGLLPYLFGAYLMQSVGKVAGKVVEEVRRQFKEIAGIMEGHVEAGLRGLRGYCYQRRDRPNGFAGNDSIVAPILVGLLLGPAALGGLLVGAIITGLFVAISMTAAERLG